jgi:hypothetical protein
MLLKDRIQCIPDHLQAPDFLPFKEMNSELVNLNED